MPLYRKPTGGGATTFGSLTDVSIGEVASNVLFTTSNTTPQTFTGLAFSIGASATEVWQFLGFVELSAVNTLMDWKMALATMPTGATMRWGGIGSNSVFGYDMRAFGASPIPLGAATDTITGGSINGTFGVIIAGKVYGGGTAGTIQFTASQNTSDAGQLTGLSGSSVTAWRVHT